MTAISGEAIAAIEKQLDGLPVGGMCHVSHDGHHFVLVKTRLDGVHTGRSRILVACVSCSVLIHEATTGPLERMEGHLFDAERTRAKGVVPVPIDPRPIPPSGADIKTRLRAIFWGEDLTRFADLTNGSLVDAVIAAVRSEPVEPVAMRLPCPTCHQLHIDTGEFATKPHHTHACQNCGEVWRPAIVPTVGVRFLPGFKDEPPPNITIHERTVRKRCDFVFSGGRPCVSETCHLSGQHYTDGVIP